jgi:15-cis-phytoene synthase
MKSVDLAESYAFCERVARERAKNFYYSFLLLPREKRLAMCAVYAFMRYCDDLSDDEGVSDRAAEIAKWEADLRAALDGRAPQHPLWPAFADTAARYRIPHEYFHEMIEGVRSDLTPRDFQTFDQLYDYCYHVASVVGLTVIHIFGFDSPEAPKLAEKCGVAFQLTNIIRDVHEDAALGRVYIPAEDLVRFNVAAADLREKLTSPALRALLEFEAKRARAYYCEAQPLVKMVHSRASLRALIGIYSRLLTRIEESGFDVMARRIRVPGWEKLWILVRSRFA